MLSATTRAVLPTILCIDDEVQGLLLRKLVLERAGYRVLTAMDGAVGLSLFRTHSIDGVVLDYCMPGMDGGQIAQAMRRERPEVPILILSALVHLPADVVALVDRTAIKGRNPRELLDKISQILCLARNNENPANRPSL